jgi:hypothetical protein
MPRTTARSTDVSRNKLFWAIGSAMVAGLLVAFWMLCSHQVRQAQARDASARIQRQAVADCLVNIPGATLGSCVASITPSRVAGAATVAPDNATERAGATHAQMSTAMPVNFVYR